MNRIQTACWFLIASAFVLAGLLVVALQNRLPQAQAGLVIQRGDYIFVTAKTTSNSDALYVLDNVNEKLLVYSLDSGRKRVDLVAVSDLVKVFAAPAAGAAGGAAPGAPVRPY